MIDLRDKVAVVTGGSSGIGHAVVTMLTDAGCAVEVADLQAIPSTDVGSTDSVNALADRVREHYGHCDYVVNSAAVVVSGTVLNVSEEEMRRAMDINVLSILRTTQALVPMMPTGSAIVNVASAAGLRALPELAGYVASKSAVIGLTGSMAIDLAALGIRVNCVSPGVVDTPMARHAQTDRSASAQAATASFQGYLIPRFGTVEEIASPIVSMLLNEYLTGSTLAVDGGRSLH